MNKLKSYQPFFVTLIVGVLILYATVMAAWISDDGLISLTQMVNFHYGDGLVFNYGERVQAFTHPTWFFLLSLLTYVANDYFYTIIFASILLSISSIFVILYYAYRQNHITAALIGFLLLVFSKAFVDYTSSGLENPLSYFLFSLTIYTLLRYETFTKNQLLTLYLLFTFIFLNRMDYALILIPVVILLLIKCKKQNVAPIFIAGNIVGAWFLFSLFYFGHFFPNTFYAKLEAGYPAVEYFQRGIQYFQVQYDEDPITLIIIIIGVLLGVVQNKKTRAVAIGLILYMLYLLKSGGDFMQGRFFAVPAYIATFLVVAYLSKKKIHILHYIVMAIILYTTTNATSPLLVGKDYNYKTFSMGVADERGFYFQKYGLVSPNRNWPKIVTLNKNKPTKSKVVCGELGSSGLVNRNETFYIDKCALTDPLLSQLPAMQKTNWRIGHQVRKVPTNYTQSVIDNRTRLKDHRLNSLYQDIKIVTQGELFSISRLKAIWKINTHDYHINKEMYQNNSLSD